MTTVYWAPWAEHADWRTLALYEPESVLQYVAKNRSFAGLEGHYLQCPAFKDYYKNVYAIRSPISITIAYDKKSNSLSISPQNQKFYDSCVLHRGHQIGENDPFLMSIAIRYLFLSKTNCLVEQLPVTMHDTPITSSVRVIAGAFDISKWFRPVDFTFEMLDESKPIVIQRGDPLFYVRFVSDEKVTLKYKEIDIETREAVSSCVELKNGERGINLKTLYELAERVKYKLWFNKKKCPFNWRNK